MKETFPALIFGSGHIRGQKQKCRSSRKAGKIRPNSAEEHLGSERVNAQGSGSNRLRKPGTTAVALSSKVSFVRFFSLGRGIPDNVRPSRQWPIIFFTWESLLVEALVNNPMTQFSLE